MSSMTPLAWVGLGVGFLVAAIAPAVLRPVLTRLGVIDVPNERSSHVRPTLRGTGLGALAGVIVGGIVMAFGFRGTGWVPMFVAIISISAVMGLVGLAEDIRQLNVAVRAGSQFLLGFVASIWLGSLVGAHWWLVVLGAFFFTAYVNFANFMDGINGISSLHGVVAGGTFAVMGAVTSNGWLVGAGLLTAVVLAAFLPWNLIPPGMFLGDVGSYLLGALIATTTIAAAFAGVPLLAALAPLSIYLVDTISVVLRRASRGEAVLSAHRTHTYQRLTDTGLSHIEVSVLVSLLTAVNAALGIVSMRGGAWFWIALALIVLNCAAYLFLPRLLGNRLPARPVRAVGEIAQPGTIPAREGFDPKRYAVIGSTGFVGSALVDALRSQGADVAAVRGPRLQLSPQHQDPNAIAAEASVHDAVAQLAEQLAAADVVINAAGLATPDGQPTAELYGANTLLPPVVAKAAEAAGAQRVIHLSSAAAQGRRASLDESLDVAPFSPYSRSKALGERTFLAPAVAADLDRIVVRATSVQGDGRPTTESLRRISRSALASVAGSGDQATVVSSIDGLVDFVSRIAKSQHELGPIMLQPWEGLTAADVLRYAGGGEPRHLPVWLCKSLLSIARSVGVLVPEIAGAGRRLELMWLGQQQASAFAESFPPVDRANIERILAGADQTTSEAKS